MAFFFFALYANSRKVIKYPLRFTIRQKQENEKISRKEVYGLLISPD